MVDVRMTPSQCEDPLSLVGELEGLVRTPFDRVPRELRRQAYGVPYVELEDASGGIIWVTRHGWNLLEYVAPSAWYRDRCYDRQGERLSKGTGAVFRVDGQPRAGRAVNLVVKFSRMAQDLPLHVSSRFPDELPRHVLDQSRFNDPFQEFGLLDELRTSRFGPSDLRILTKRPLAIYSPGQRFKVWQLGRSEQLFQQHSLQLADNQQRLDGNLLPIEMSIERQYITLFHWVHGVDAEVLMEAGLISTSATTELVIQVMRDLAAKGFRVLDTKPNHIILRRRHDGRLLRRRGRLVYVLIDFELLQRTDEYGLRRTEALNDP